MSDTTPRFSIVIPHYDGSISDEFLIRGLQTLVAQSFRSFEILLYHDGPPSRPLPDIGFVGPHLASLKMSERRFNDWGHSLRDQGIREARGDYIVHFNPDNVLYPNALEVLDAYTRLPVPPVPDPIAAENPDILIYAVLMRGMQSNAKVSPWRNRGDPSRGLIYTGMPPTMAALDCMQVVIRRSVWLEIGGWYDRSVNSDGLIYPKLIAERGARYVPAVLGEHW